MGKRKLLNPAEKTICIACIAAGLFVAAFGWYCEKTVQQLEIKTYEGPFQQYTIKTSSRSVVRFFSVGEMVFQVNSAELPAFNRAFSSEVQAGETVFVEYLDQAGAENTVPRTLLGLRTEKAVYMDSSDTLANYIRVYQRAILWGIVLMAIGVIHLFFDDKNKRPILRCAARPSRRPGR